MKNIADIYEDEGIACTPGNTMGMGNPTPPGVAGETGTEPLSPTAKAKKRKKKIQEGVLSDIDTTIENDSDLMRFINWYVDGYLSEYKKEDRQETIEDVLEMVSVKGPGHYEIKCLNWSFGIPELIIPKSGIPNWLKKITFTETRVRASIKSWTNDLSGLEINVYKSGKELGDIEFAFKISPANTSIKIGKILCNKFNITSAHIEDLIIDKNSLISILDLEDCKKLKYIYGNAHFGCYRYVFPAHFVRSYMMQNGLIPWGSVVEISKK